MTLRACWPCACLLVPEHLRSDLRPNLGVTVRLFRRDRPQGPPPPPPCPKCGQHGLVTLDLRESDQGVAGHFYCAGCSITTHLFAPRPDRPRIRWEQA